MVEMNKTLLDAVPCFSQSQSLLLIHGKMMPTAAVSMGERLE